MKLVEYGFEIIHLILLRNFLRMSYLFDSFHNLRFGLVDFSLSAGIFCLGSVVGCFHLLLLGCCLIWSYFYILLVFHCLFERFFLRVHYFTF